MTKVVLNKKKKNFLKSVSMNIGYFTENRTVLKVGQIKSQTDSELWVLNDVELSSNGPYGLYTLGKFMSIIEENHENHLHFACVGKTNKYEHKFI